VATRSSRTGSSSNPVICRAALQEGRPSSTTDRLARSISHSSSLPARTPPARSGSWPLLMVRECTVSEKNDIRFPHCEGFLRRLLPFCRERLS
jgi:hypothetical protein